MKKIEYKIIVGDKGFKEMEERVSELMNNGWKTIGGIAFNAGYPYQAMAKAIEMKAKEASKEEKKGKVLENRALTANEAMRRIDDLT